MNQLDQKPVYELHDSAAIVSSRGRTKSATVTTTIGLAFAVVLKKQQSVLPFGGEG